MRTCPKCLNPRLDTDFTALNNTRYKHCNYCNSKVASPKRAAFKESQVEQSHMRKSTVTEQLDASSPRAKRIQKTRYALYDRAEAKRLEDEYAL